MKIIPLSEGSFTVDSTKKFIPFHESDLLADRPVGSLLVEIQPFVIIKGNEIILLDTGLGFADHEEMQLHKNLRRNNINPGDVTRVFLSHLHKDHAGGISKQNHGSTFSLSFPNAVYYVHEKELEYAIQKGKPSYEPENFSILPGNPRLTRLSGISGKIGDVSYEMTGGHCPYHTVYWIKDQSETVFFGGDVAPQLQQMKHKFIAKYDAEGKLSMELRSKWWLQAKQEEWKFLFYHDIKTPIYPV